MIPEKAQKKAKQMKAIGSQMTVDRAEEIALAIAKYQATREEISIGQGAASHLRKKGRALGIAPEDYFEFGFRIMLPAALKAEFNEGMVPQLEREYRLNQNGLEKVALKLVENVGLMVSGDSLSKLRRMSDETGIETDDLREFYVRFILPKAIAILAGWKSCSIGPDEPATKN